MPGRFRQGRPKRSSDAAARVDFGRVLSASFRPCFLLEDVDKASPLGRALQTAIIAYGPLLEKARNSNRKREHDGMVRTLSPRRRNSAGMSSAPRASRAGRVGSLREPAAARLVLAPNCKDGRFLVTALRAVVPSWCRRKSRTSVAWIQSAPSWVRRCRAHILPLLCSYLTTRRFCSQAKRSPGLRGRKGPQRPVRLEFPCRNGNGVQPGGQGQNRTAENSCFGPLPKPRLRVLYSRLEKASAVVLMAQL